MHQVKHSAIVPYSCEAMFNLVNNVEAYPEFVPHCSKTEIHEKTDKTLKASIFLKKGPFSHSFTTHNICVFPHKIDMDLVEGPFSSFEGHWQFDSLGESACKISLQLIFEIKNSLLNRAFAKLFDSLANQMLDAFCQRANQQKS